jgi:type IV secretory pathway TraG/TraD family ATPase VirD4
MAGTPSPQARALTGSDLAILVAVAAIAGVVLALWLTGEVAALIASGRPAPVGARDLGHILIRIPDHLADPARAWPARAAATARPRPLLPRGAPRPHHARAAHRRRRAPDAVNQARRAPPRWPARRRSPCRLGAPRGAARAGRHAQPGRLIVGRARRRGRLLATPPDTHLALVAPTRSGKTSRGIIPWLLEHNGPAVVLSTKPDVLHATVTRRRGLGRVWLFDPFGEQSSAWTPIQGCESWNRALMTAEWLGDAANEGHTSEAGHFWRGEAATLLAPLLYAAALSRADMPQVLHWLHDRSVKEVLDILRTDHTQGTAAAAQLEGKHAEDDRNRATTYMSATALLKAYRFPRLQAYTKRDDLTTDAFLNGKPNTVYIIAPEHQQELLRPIIVALVSQLYVAAVEKANTGNAPGGKHRWDPPLRFLLDEAANIAPLRPLPNYLAQSLGLGIPFVTVWQDLSQLRERYGPDAAGSVLSNSSVKLFLGPISDAHTLRYLEQLLGDIALPHHNITQSGDWSEHRSTTQVTHYRPVATAPELRQIQPDRGLLLCERIPPALIALRPWYQDAALQQLAA